MARLASLLLASTLLFSVHAETLCGPGNLCPAFAPCCSEFGYCGTGTVCLGGCNPLHSNTLTSCRPEPKCADQTITFPNMDRILSNSTMYEGNATLHDFVVDSGTAFLTPNKELVLTLTQQNNGTRISSTRYVHYGRITARIKTARSPGVVNAFITMSDVKDEIDWEWPGAQVTEVQSNYFFLGHVDYSASNGKTHTGLTDTYANYHDYTIDWQPDTLTWSIDGNVVRTVNRVDTLSEDGTHYAYPTTPARVQVSIWPAGIPSSPKGTVEWAGGMIDWNDPDYVAQGNQFSILVEQVEIDCTKDSLSLVANNGSFPPNADAYQYTTNDTKSGVVPRVVLSNESTNVNAAMARVEGALVNFGVVAATVLGLGLGVVGMFV